MSRFDFMCDNISGVDCNGNRYGQPDENGVSAWYMEADYDKSIGNDYHKEDSIEFEVDGVMYREHWFFVNEKHNSNVIGYSLMNEAGDVKFCVVGCRTDFVCSFETMYQYLTDSIYFVD